MRNVVLSLPACVVGVPLVVALIAAQARVEQPPPPVAAPPALPPVEQAADLPDNAAMEKMARENPIAFLENCLRRYQRDVQGYSLTMQKQERLQGTLHPVEVIEVHFREQPHSVFMNWKQGARRAQRALYVEGENDGKMLARPTGFAARLVRVVARDVDGDDARASGRYTLNNFGIKKATERTLAFWKAAKDQGKLNVEYRGIQKIKEAGNRECFVLHRVNAEPESDGVKEMTLFVDTETWLQVGSILKGAGGELIGEYYFRDIRLNPEFAKGQFERSAIEGP